MKKERKTSKPWSPEKILYLGGENKAATMFIWDICKKKSKVKKCSFGRFEKEEEEEEEKKFIDRQIDRYILPKQKLKKQYNKIIFCKLNK